jgi:carbamoyl-phosphate synthase large subunit
MGKRTDIQKILIIGAGPIVIGQACEFDYSGTQACKALREEGYKVILVNSNPATIMTDPDMADEIYIEPVEWKTVEQIIAKERPDALLPTMGGQTALNCALDLDRHGVLTKYGVEMIGANADAIDMAEDRERFRQAMTDIGIGTPQSFIAHSVEEALPSIDALGYPIIIRPSFTMGGSGGGIAYNRDEFIEIVERGVEMSPTNEVLLEKSLLGWKEYEMEVVRDKADNCIIVCSIENFDPMGVHTGDSITVAPAQTLTDKEYQILRDASLAVLRKIGVETGGSNVQFSTNPETGEMIVIEMNPRVSRSSALASKATGFPIAKIAAKLAVGYTLDELSNDITGGLTPASFEPTIDYVVTKVPRFTFEKFKQANDRLTTQMKSVGEAMAIGGTFQESLQKALRSLEVGSCGLDGIYADIPDEEQMDTIRQEISQPGADRIWYLADAFRYGMSFEEIHKLTSIDPWFLAEVEDIINTENALKATTLVDLDAVKLKKIKQKGFSDKQIAQLVGETETAVRQYRHAQGIHATYKHVDSCAAEFETTTAYLYSTYADECEANPTDNKKIMILGGGPNRIGQGIEFDYCCVHATLALKEDGYETIMVNCNPETVSTDYDTADRLYFEPLTLEDVLEIVRVENPDGVIVQYGGQTPLKLARALEAEGVKIIGTSPDAIDAAEDRERFQQLLNKLDLKQPENAIARSEAEALALADSVGYPLVVRPSYVLGGRAMEIVYTLEELKQYMTHAVEASDDAPVLLDRFLNNAIEVDVDCVNDGEQVVIGGIMEHIEQAGVHSGDSACSLPPYTLSAEIQQRIAEQTKAMAIGLNVRGLMNTQFAVQGDDIYVIEVNPRASRTVPFVSKAIAKPLAKIGARVMAGQTLAAQGFTESVVPKMFAVKEAVFPFVKFPGVDPILGPEMKSTGEVMGLGASFGEAYLKAQLGAGNGLPKTGNAFISVKNSDKEVAVQTARKLAGVGFTIYATSGTYQAITDADIPCVKVNKVNEQRPNIVDNIKNGEIHLIINTTEGKKSIKDSFAIRREALSNRVSYTTTAAAGMAMALAMEVIETKIVEIKEMA